MSSADVSATVDPYLVLVTDVRVLGRYVLELTFDTGETKILDMEPLMWGRSSDRFLPTTTSSARSRSITTQGRSRGPPVPIGPR